MTKKQFIKQYKQLSEADRATVKQFHEDKLREAIFVDTYETAERTLLWIREYEEGIKI